MQTVPVTPSTSYAAAAPAADSLKNPIPFDLEKAKQLLENTSKRAYEVAGEVGFSDPHYFSVAFKKATGKTPTEYAKEKRKK